MAVLRVERNRKRMLALAGLAWNWKNDPDS
jgi:hypothetical protein